MHSKVNKKNIRQRIKARQNTVQALYQWLLTNKDLDEVMSEFENDEYKLAKTDVTKLGIPISFSDSIIYLSAK